MPLITVVTDTDSAILTCSSPAWSVVRLLTSKGQWHCIDTPPPPSKCAVGPMCCALCCQLNCPPLSVAIVSSLLLRVAQYQHLQQTQKEFKLSKVYSMVSVFQRRSNSHDSLVKQQEVKYRLQSLLMDIPAGNCKLSAKSMAKRLGQRSGTASASMTGKHKHSAFPSLQQLLQRQARFGWSAAALGILTQLDS